MFKLRGKIRCLFNKHFWVGVVCATCHPFSNNSEPIESSIMHLECWSCHKKKEIK